MPEVIRSTGSPDPMKQGPKLSLLARLFRTLFQEIILATYLNGVKLSDLPTGEKMPITKVLEPEADWRDLMSEDLSVASEIKKRNDPFDGDPFDGELQNEKMDTWNHGFLFHEKKKSPREQLERLISALIGFARENPEVVLNNREKFEKLSCAEEIFRAAQEALEGKGKE